MNQKVFCQNEYTKQAISGIIAIHELRSGAPPVATRPGHPSGKSCFHVSS